MGTVDITPVIAPGVWQDALKRNGIRGIAVDADTGRFTVTDEQAVIRTLVQALLLAHINETVVNPSRAQALRGRVTAAVEQVASTSNHIKRRGLANDLIDDLTQIADALEAER